MTARNRFESFAPPKSPIAAIGTKFEGWGKIRIAAAATIRANTTRKFAERKSARVERFFEEADRGFVFETVFITVVFTLLYGARVQGCYGQLVQFVLKILDSFEK